MNILKNNESITEKIVDFLKPSNLQSKIAIAVFLVLFGGDIKNILASEDSSYKKSLTGFYIPENPENNPEIRKLFQKIFSQLPPLQTPLTGNNPAYFNEFEEELSPEEKKLKIKEIVEDLKKKQKLRAIVEKTEESLRENQIPEEEEMSPEEKKKKIQEIVRKTEEFLKNRQRPENPIPEKPKFETTQEIAEEEIEKNDTLSRIKEGVIKYNESLTESYEEKIEIPEKGYCLIVEKSIKELNLLLDGKLYKIDEFPYVVSLGAEKGDKEELYDIKTPEGKFYLTHINYYSTTGKSIGISYPSKVDAERGLQNGLITKTEYNRILRDLKNKKLPYEKTALGGNIFIHTNRYHGTTYDNSENWTGGCLAITKYEMDNLISILKGSINSQNKPWIIILP